MRLRRRLLNLKTHSTELVCSNSLIAEFFLRLVKISQIYGQIPGFLIPGFFRIQNPQISQSHFFKFGISWDFSGFLGISRDFSGFLGISQDFSGLTGTGISRGHFYSRLKKNTSQSHYREVPRWEIFMEQELRFGLNLGRMADFPAFIASKSFDL